MTRRKKESRRYTSQFTCYSMGRRRGETTVNSKKLILHFFYVHKSTFCVKILLCSTLPLIRFIALTTKFCTVLLLRRSRFLDKSQVVTRVFCSSIFAITDKDLLFVQTLSWGFVLASVPVAYCHFRHVLVRKFNTLSSNYQ